MLSSQQRKAEIARLKVESRALELGVICSRPSVEGTRYDCILDIAGKLYRAQIKYCDCAAGNSSGALQLRLRSNVGQGAARCYREEEVDALLVLLISLEILRKTEAVVRLLLLQEKFAEIVQKFERVRHQQREATRQAEHLFQTLLHRAFRGEL
jgi:hypothetical protein